MTTAEMNEVTRQEWRDLGFFYDYDKAGSRWQLIGSQLGLLRFVEILDSYVADPKNERLSEHEHYGPYWFLKLLTWREAAISESAICGTLSDFRRLAAMVRSKLDSAPVGSTFNIGHEYALGSKSLIAFEVREEGFDPASADPLLSNAN